MKKYNDFLKESNDLNIKIDVEGKNYLVDMLIENLSLVVKKNKTKTLRITTISGFINKEKFDIKESSYETNLTVTLSNKDIIVGDYSTRTNNINIKINDDVVYDLINKTFDNEVLIDKIVEHYKKYLKSNRYKINESNIDDDIEVGDEVVVLPKLEDYIINKRWGKSMFNLIGNTYKIKEIQKELFPSDQQYDRYYIIGNGIRYYVYRDSIELVDEKIKPKIRWYKNGKLE